MALTSLLFLRGEPALADPADTRIVESAPGAAVDRPVPDAAFQPDEPDFYEPQSDFAASSPFGPDPDPTDDRQLAQAAPDAATATDADPYGGLPDPLAGMQDWDEAIVTPTPDAYVRPAPELTIGFARAELPEGIAGYEPPDDDRPAQMTAAPVRTSLPFAPDGWDEPRRTRPQTATALPAEYVGLPPATPAADPQPFDQDSGRDPSFETGQQADDLLDDGFGEEQYIDDGFGRSGIEIEANRRAVVPAAAVQPADDRPADRVPAAVGAGLTVTRSAAGPAAFGSPHTYQLWVKNDGEAPATASVEEIVGPGVRVVNVDPPAAFTPGRSMPAAGEGVEVGGGTLRWDFAALPPGATKQMAVTVYPLPPAAGAGPAETVAFTTEARVVGQWSLGGATLVSEPVSATPPIDDFEVLEEPEPPLPEPVWEPRAERVPEPLPDPAVTPTQMLAEPREPAPPI
ncbi:MAG: hypothetical protein AAF907_13870, partial [Planctomycetota bacterium]